MIVSKVLFNDATEIRDQLMEMLRLDKFDEAIGELDVVADQRMYGAHRSTESGPLPGGLHSQVKDSLAIDPESLFRKWRVLSAIQSGTYRAPTELIYRPVAYR